MLRVGEDAKQGFGRGAAARATQQPEAGDVAFGVNEVNRGRDVVFIVALAHVVVVDAIDAVGFADCAVRVNQERRADFKILHETLVGAATAVDQKHQLAIHLLEKVRETIPEGELAPGSRSVFAATEVQNHHFAAMVAQPPFAVVGVAQLDLRRGVAVH